MPVAPTRPPPTRERIAASASDWSSSVAGELFQMGSAHRTAAAAGLMPPFGLLNVDAPILAASSYEELAAATAGGNFSTPFRCKVSR